MNALCRLLFSMLVLGTIISCSDDDSTGDDGNSNSDGDTDGDSDADGDSDSDADADPVECESDPYCTDMVNAHNYVRQEVNAGTFYDQPAPGTPIPDVTWDAALAQVAHDWASRCEWNHNEGRTEDYEALGGSDYVGENIAMNSNESTPMNTVVDQWCSEAADYDYASNSCSDVCGHYTQVVWAASARIGCATVYCETWLGGGIDWPGYFTVCNYAPGGNWGGEKPY